MKRTKMAPRAVPLRRSPRRRPTDLGLRKPAAPGEGRARRETARRAGDVCEVQLEGRCVPGAPLNFHHRQNSSVGGLWTVPNGLRACGSGTTGCHGWITEHPAGARAKGWSVRSHVDPRRTPVMYRGRWVLLLDDGHLLVLATSAVVTSLDGSEPVYLGEVPEA